MDCIVICDDADLMLAAAAVGALDHTADVAGLRRHLHSCAQCREAAVAYRASTDALALTVEDRTPSPRLRSQLLAVVHEEAGRARAKAPTPSRVRRLWDRVPTGRGLTVVGFGGAFAASAMAALALLIGHPAPVAAPVAVNVVHACGLTAQPDACGTLTLPDGTGTGPQQATLTAIGLEPTPTVDGHADATYEAWFIGADHQPRPAGFLVEQTDGTWRVAMSGNLHGVVAIALTREPFGGSARPTGTEVLRLSVPSSSA